MRGLARRILAAGSLLALLSGPLAAQEPLSDAQGTTPLQVRPAHAIAMHGKPKYGPAFTHFDYVNPDAPKGGTLKQHAIGSFDSLHPWIVKGTPPVGIGLVYDTLLTSSADEAFTEYGLIAESVEVPDDRSWVVFTLREEARFHDGHPITADDVIWTFNSLREKGDPFYRFYYANVAAVEKLGPLRVKFSFDGAVNRELPLIIGQMPVLPKHYWADRDFTQATLEPPLSSGPYRVARWEPGRFVEYERVADYWGKDLPVNVGKYNFGTIRYDYYRDTTVALEAFKAGAYDLRVENVSKLWATGYEVPALARGEMVKREFEHDMPSGMQGFAYNLRNPLFSDPRVRRALAYAFDFEWTNKTLFYGQYARTRSYFDNSELASRGLPSDGQRELLEPLKDDVPGEVFTEVYTPPAVVDRDDLRDNLKTALGLLREAGWRVEDGVLMKDGRPFQFEILLSSPTWERITLPFAQNLRRLGIEATVRTVDSAQFENRVESFDFDMIVAVWGQSLSPGNEQREFWGCRAAETPGSRNYTGICSPAVEALIDLIVQAPDRDALITRTRALDRVLLWNHLVIPHWHTPYTRVAYWDKFGLPPEVPMQGVQILTWWIDPDRAGRVERVQDSQPRPDGGAGGESGGE